MKSDFSGRIPSASLATAAILLALTTSVSASHHGMSKGHNMPTFADVDLNNDGRIVAAEFYEVRGKRMAERAKAGGKMKNAAAAPTFESIDLDDDGEVTAEEFATHQAEMRKKHARRKAKTST